MVYFWKKKNLFIYISPTSYCKKLNHYSSLLWWIIADMRGTAVVYRECKG